MTLSEFKAWFEGFTENIEGEPTAKQWKKIKARVAEIDGAPVTERIFVDRYWHYGPRWYPYWGYSSAGLGLGLPSFSGNLTAASDTVQLYAGNNIEPVDGFNAGAAMLALGRADAQGAA